MTTPPPLTIFERVEAALGQRFRLETMVAASRERVLFTAQDKLLTRRVSLRVNLYPDDQTRAWFLREAPISWRPMAAPTPTCTSASAANRSATSVSASCWRFTCGARK